MSDFLDWLAQKHNITKLSGISTSLIRQDLSEFGNIWNKGGVHARYRSIKAFLNFYSFEYESKKWSNPIDRVELNTPECKTNKRCRN